MESKTLTIIAAGTVGLLIMCMGTLASCGASSGALAAACAGASFHPPTNASADPLGRYDSEQLTNVAVIVDAGVRKHVPPRGWVIAVATALQESTLHNLPNLGATNDHDSIGLFQQRPSQGWGTPQQLADPAYQAGKFYDKLLTVAGWQTMTLTDAAQNVQRSAYPDAYAKWTADATALVATVGAPMGVSGLGLPGCVPGASGGWTQPVHAPIVSGFRTAARPGHDGVDLAAPRNTIIVAASAGTVLTATCNAHTRNGGTWGCDHDGDVNQTIGCGWYADLAHADGVITRYCHMRTRPFVNTGDTVVVGQPIGLVGSTGHSSGPHLHFEVHVGADASSPGAVDPVPFMASVGAPIGVGRL